MVLVGGAYLVFAITASGEWQLDFFIVLGFLLAVVTIFMMFENLLETILIDYQKSQVICRYKKPFRPIRETRFSFHDVEYQIISNRGFKWLILSDTVQRVELLAELIKFKGSSLENLMKDLEQAKRKATTS